MAIATYRRRRRRRCCRYESAISFFHCDATKQSVHVCAHVRAPDHVPINICLTSAHSLFYLDLIYKFLAISSYFSASALLHLFVLFNSEDVYIKYINHIKYIFGNEHRYGGVGGQQFEISSHL